MGDAISPGATIVALAYMEHLELCRIPKDVRDRFQCMRYMDDLLAIWKDEEGNGATKAIDTMKYESPLTLEDTHDPNFLETHIEIKDRRLTFRLKNVNEDGDRKVWRYAARWLDGAPFNVKRGLLLSSLRKVHAYASDETQLCKSAIAKLKEFSKAGYPRGVLLYMCNVVYTSTQVRTWRYLATTYIPTYL